MMDEHQSLCSENVHPSARSQCIPFYGCQPLWMGAHLELMRLSFHGRWTEDQSQLHLRGVTTTSISPYSSSVLSKITNTSKRKIPTSKSTISVTSGLGVIKQSIRDKKFLQNLQIFSQKSRRASTQKVYDAKWVVYSNWCCRKKVNSVSAPLTVIADFLIHLFSEIKQCQISTIKGYRSMISNTLKFKTGNRIGSNPVFQN